MTDHFADASNMVRRISDEILHRIVAPEDGDIVVCVTAENAREIADEAARAALAALSRVLAAHGLKVTAREATEDSADMGLSVLDVHMAATAHYPIELPEMVWRAMHDAAPNLLGDGA